MPDINIPNLTIYNPPRHDTPLQYVTTQQHLFGIGEIIFITGVFIILAYWYIRVTKGRAQYEAWTNPNGRVINLYKIVRRIFWAYVATVIVFGILAILTAPK